jgi:hypothetical protein
MLNRRKVLAMFAGGAALAIGGPARADHPRMTRLIDKAHELPSIGQRIDFISRALLGTPYRGHTLIGGPRQPEKFVSRDDAFDCVTYVEAVLAAAMVRKPSDYAAALRHIRYRGGEVSWRERNHYFAQWCDSNVANQRCARVAMPGGISSAKTLAYMPALGALRLHLTTIPRASLLANTSLLRSGDVIGFVSERPRLDYFHIGFVIVSSDGGLSLRHAAQSKRRVLDEPLNRFLTINHVKSVTLLRAREPDFTGELV